MDYKEIKPYKKLTPFIHAYWELKGAKHDSQWFRIFPDGCTGLVINLGDTCLTDNGSVSMEFGKTYAVGAMTSFKESFIDSNSHLVGVCLKPGAFSSFFNYAPQNQIINSTIQLEKSKSFDLDTIFKGSSIYLNQFFIERVRHKNNPLHAIVRDIDSSKGKLSIHELSKRNNITIRQLERHFKSEIGLSPKEYSNIVRFQNALRVIENSNNKRSLLDIAFECGYYDHAHLAKEIKQNTGLPPTKL